MQLLHCHVGMGSESFQIINPPKKKCFDTTMFFFNHHLLVLIVMIAGPCRFLCTWQVFYSKTGEPKGRAKLRFAQRSGAQAAAEMHLCGLPASF